MPVRLCSQFDSDSDSATEARGPSSPRVSLPRTGRPQPGSLGFDVPGPQHRSPEHAVGELKVCTACAVVYVGTHSEHADSRVLCLREAAVELARAEISLRGSATGSEAAGSMAVPIETLTNMLRMRSTLREAKVSLHPLLTQLRGSDVWQSLIGTGMVRRERQTSGFGDGAPQGAAGDALHSSLSSPPADRPAMGSGSGGGDPAHAPPS